MPSQTHIRLRGGPYDGNLAVPFDRSLGGDDSPGEVPADLPKRIQSVDPKPGKLTPAWRYRRTKRKDADGNRIYEID